MPITLRHGGHLGRPTWSNLPRTAAAQQRWAIGMAVLRAGPADEPPEPAWTALMNRVWTGLEQASDGVGEEDGNRLVRRVTRGDAALNGWHVAIGKFHASTIRAGPPVQPG